MALKQEYHEEDTKADERKRKVVITSLAFGIIQFVDNDSTKDQVDEKMQ